MWDGADPDVEVFAYRHTQSKANVDNANYGNKTPLSEKGVLQVPFVFDRMEQQRVQLIACSHAERAYAPVVENAATHKLPIAPNEFFNEYRRPESTIGKSNDDPGVVPLLHRRIAEFGSAHASLDGAESFAETVMIIVSGLDELRSTALAHGIKRMGLLSHGLRLRQIESMILAEGDWEKFAWLFKSLYKIGGYANGGCMHFWYGYPFRQSPEYVENATKCWNVERGDVSHIPPELQ